MMVDNKLMKNMEIPQKKMNRERVGRGEGGGEFLLEERRYQAG